MDHRSRPTARVSPSQEDGWDTVTVIKQRSPSSSPPPPHHHHHHHQSFNSRARADVPAESSGWSREDACTSSQHCCRWETETQNQGRCGGSAPLRLLLLAYLSDSVLVHGPADLFVDEQQGVQVSSPAVQQLVWNVGIWSQHSALQLQEPGDMGRGSPAYSSNSRQQPPSDAHLDRQSLLSASFPML